MKSVSKGIHAANAISAQSSTSATHLEDLLNLHQLATHQMFQLEALFSTIKQGLKTKNTVDLERLAEIGQYLAFDWGNNFDVDRADLEKQLEATNPNHPIQ